MTVMMWTCFALNEDNEQTPLTYASCTNKNMPLLLCEIITELFQQVTPKAVTNEAL
jgi:hypothetical protein